MTKITRGNIVSDRAVHPEYISSAQKHNWKVKKIPSDVTENMSDETFAEIYNKNNSIFLTHDKTAYTQQTFKGFAGYIEYDSPSRSEFQDCLLNFEKVISSVKSSDVIGYRLQVNKEGGYEKITIQTQKKSRKPLKTMVKKGRKKPKQR
jgi:hypothetical protein